MAEPVPPSTPETSENVFDPASASVQVGYADHWFGAFFAMYVL